MYLASILFSLIFGFNGLSFLSGAKLQIESRSAECPPNWSNIDGTCFSPPRKTSEFAEGRDCNSDCRVVKKLCTDDGANLATKEETHIWLNNGGDRLGKTYGLTSTMNGNRHWFTKNLGDYGWYEGCCHHTNRFFVCAKKSVPTTTTTTEAPTTPAAEKAGECEDKNVLCQMEPSFLLDILCQIDTVKEQCPKRCNSCPEPVETTEAPTTTTAMPVCERKYNGYYSYGDCGSQNGVNSFEECCELTKQRNATSSRNIIRFSWNGNSCAFKCGGKQDNRGGSWWSSAEDISTCTCQ